MPVRSDLPFGSEFSPNQVELPKLLDMVVASKGNWKTLEQLIRANYFTKHSALSTDAKSKSYNQQKLANNTKLSLRAYGITDKSGAALTQFGEQLHAARNDPAKLYDQLARHILLNLKGMSVVECIKDMHSAGELITLETLRDALEERGVHVPKAGKSHTTLCLWLRQASVLTNWAVNEKRIRELIGIGPDTFPALAGLTPAQRYFLITLGNTGETKPQPWTAIAKLAHATYGIRFPEKTTPKVVLQRLVEMNFIRTVKTTTGRGGRAFDVKPGNKFEMAVLTPLLNQLEGQINPQVFPLLRKSLAEILKEVDSNNKHVAGLALEALAFKLMRFLGMDFLVTRLRGDQTGGAEVDVIFETARLVFSRWQVQCKRTSHVRLDDVAKEVGLTHFLRSNVIVIVTTGVVGGEARRYATHIMRTSNLSIVLVEGADLKMIRDDVSTIVDVFQREARRAMNLKNLVPADIVETSQ
jgi:site-specific DNA-methyltransferase (cytosine-N4-specific)